MASGQDNADATLRRRRPPSAQAGQMSGPPQRSVGARLLALVILQLLYSCARST